MPVLVRVLRPKLVPSYLKGTAFLCKQGTRDSLYTSAVLQKVSCIMLSSARLNCSKKIS